MAYTRWTSKHSWYIYWACASDDETRDGQLLAVWYTRDPENLLYSYERLKYDREGVWNEIKQRQDKSRMYGRKIFDESIDEWLEDVEKEYPLEPDIVSESL
jgi:hypothetical protein